MMMNEPEDLQHLTLWGIVKESFSLLCSFSRLLISLALTLILPLCFVILAHNLVTAPLIAKIDANQEVVDSDPDPSVTTPSEAHTMHDLALERSRLFLIFAIYLFFLLIFSLLSTAAFVYSVACAYSGKPLSYAKVMSVVPKVWRRLVVTFVWAFLLLFSYQVIGILCIIIFLILLSAIIPTQVVLALAWPCLAVFFGGLIYLSCIWHLASVISVMETTYGLGAMRKSLTLIRGKRIVGFVLFSLYLFDTVVIGSLFNMKVVNGGNLTLRIVLAFVLILLLTLVTMVGLLVQTVFYFACKAYHHENIDKLALSEHLGAYSGEYVPLKSSIQMEPMQA